MLGVLLRVDEQRILLLIPDLCLKTIFQEYGPDEAAIDTYKLELSPGFGYRTLPDGMMYAYVTCRPDIGRQFIKPATLTSDVMLDVNIPLLSIDINQPKLMVFVGDAYAND